MRPDLHADIAAPPTFMIDFLRLEYPANVMAGLSLAAGTVALFGWLRPRKSTTGRPLRYALALVLPVLLFIGGNFVFFLMSPTPPRPRPPLFQSPPQTKVEGNQVAPAPAPPAAEPKS